jgi:hypothetical protein
MAHDTTLAVEHGDGPALPRVEVDGPRFRGAVSHVFHAVAPRYAQQSSPPSGLVPVAGRRTRQAPIHPAGVSDDRRQYEPPGGQPASRGFSSVRGRPAGLCPAHA